MIKHDVQPCAIFEESRYKMFDVMQYLNMFSQGKGKLDEYLKAFNIGEKYNGYDGSKVQELYDNEQYDEIEKYGLQDAVLEARLIRKTLPFFKTKLKITDVLAYDLEVVIPNSFEFDTKLKSKNECLKD